MAEQEENRGEIQIRKEIYQILIDNKVAHLEGEIFGRINEICDIKTGAD